MAKRRKIDTVSIASARSQQKTKEFADSEMKYTSNAEIDDEGVEEGDTEEAKGERKVNNAPHGAGDRDAKTDKNKRAEDLHACLDAITRAGFSDVDDFMYEYFTNPHLEATVDAEFYQHPDQVKKLLGVLKRFNPGFLERLAEVGVLERWFESMNNGRGASGREEEGTDEDDWDSDSVSEDEDASVEMSGEENGVGDGDALGAIG